MSRPCMSVNATTTVSISPAETFLASWSLVSNSARALSLLATASPGDKTLEELARPWQVGRQLLGMALHGDDQTVVGLDRFHGAVVASRRLLQARRQRSNRLVVKAVDPDLVLACRLSQLGRGVDLDAVGEVAAPEGPHIMVLQVLHERAAHGHVDHLLAT